MTKYHGISFVYVFGMLSLINLERALRQGKSPIELGATALETGAQKTGYLYITSKGKKIVIKTNTGGWKDREQKRPPDLTKYGCRTIYQTKAGQYVIQEFVTQLQKRDYTDIVPRSNPVWKIISKIRATEIGDYHAANFGIDDQNQLVCFDW
jgi:hypothetical protein